MAAVSVGYTFDAFEIDPVARRVTREGEVVRLPERHFDVLLALVSRAGSVVSKDALIDVAWRDVAVTDNSLEQAISLVRRALGSAPTGEPYIATVPRQGYRFTATVTRTTRQESDERLDDLLAPHRAWLEGRAALETLSGDRCGDAMHTFERVLRSDPDSAAAHVGLANACAFLFEASRADINPDRAALTRALEHARLACRLAPDWGESWATLGFALNRAGQTQDGLAAVRRATALEPDNWRHHLREAFVSWGEERLRAADRTLRLMPGLGLAHLLAVTVHVARQSFERAEREVGAGAAAQDAHRENRFAPIGLHWLDALLRLRRGDETGALASLDRELSFETSGHLYARECCAHVRYAMGAIAWRHGDVERALTGFAQALTGLPGHPPSLAATAALTTAAAAHAQFEQRLTMLRAGGAHVDAAHADVIRATVSRTHAAPASAILRAFEDASASAAGWTLPLDPILRPEADDEAWRPVLALLRQRAA
jgi:DNA-binding winged helix-turn-helix (wHTH) protein